MVAIISAAVFAISGLFAAIVIAHMFGQYKAAIIDALGYRPSAPVRRPAHIVRRRNGFSAKAARASVPVRVAA